MKLGFYRPGDALGCFSNFSRLPIVIDGKTWPTSEHYFQAQKFAGTPYEEAIRCVRSAMGAAMMGRSRKHTPREDWDQVKEDVMYKALLAKYEQHQIFRDTLQNTGDAEIIEHTTRDLYWGDPGDGSGQNRLGKLLMRLRSEKRKNG